MGRSVNQRIIALKQALEGFIEPAPQHPHKACWEGKWDLPPSTPGSSTSSRQSYRAPKPPPETGEACPCQDPTHIFFAAAPRLDMIDYMRRLIKYMEFGDDDVLFVVALMYLERAAQRCRDGAAGSPRCTPLVTTYSAQRLFFTCCVLAAKFGMEKPFKNKFYADVGAIPNCHIMLQLEVALLNLLDYSLFPSVEEFRLMYHRCFDVPPPQSPASLKRAPPVGLEIIRRRDSCSGSRRGSVTVSPLPNQQQDSPLPQPGLGMLSSPVPIWEPLTESEGGGVGGSPLPRQPSHAMFKSYDDMTVLNFATAQPSEGEGD